MTSKESKEFHRPREFNPVPPGKPQDRHKEFGFEGDPAADGDAEESEDTVAKAEFDSLNEKFNEMKAAREAAENELKQKDARIEELQRLSKQAQIILVNKHKDLIKALSEEYEQAKNKMKLAFLEGSDAADRAKLLDGLTKENTSLREQIKELEIVATDLIRDLQDAKEKAEKDKPGTTKRGAGTASTASTAAAGRSTSRSTTPARSSSSTSEEKGAKELTKKLAEKDAHIKKLETQLKSGGKPLAVTTDSGDSGLREENERLREELGKMKSPRNSASPPADSSSRVAELEKELASAKEQLEKQSKSDEVGKLKAELASLLGDQNKRSTAAKRKRAILEKCRTNAQGLKDDLAAIRATLKTGPSTITSLLQPLPAKVDEWKKKIAKNAAKSQEKYDELLKNYKKERELRKKLFNAMQELKGNIRVFCRVRPLLLDETETVVTFPEEESLVIKNADRKTEKGFEFEKVFLPTATQGDVFEDVKDLVLSVLDGYNVCIFAYGQTGSGKTFTMEGSKDNPGLYSRTLRKVFEEVSQTKDSEFKVSISLMEIYNNKIQDLLETHDGPLNIVRRGDMVEVDGLKKVDVSNEEEVLGWLRSGAKNRATAATNINLHSSRSHLILSVYVFGTNKMSGQTQAAKLHLIDLAGSERVKDSGVTGKELKEAASINSSLAALGNCISARANKTAHVPYRDSKLTEVLQDSLEKNSKTLMFVQISPTPSCAGESIISLQFAERVRKVELGKAEKNLVKSTSLPSASRVASKQ